MILYHYTDYTGYNGILNTRNIRASIDVATDAYHGKGQYFTDLSPDRCEIHIMEECFGGINSSKRVDYYIKMKIPGSFVRKCRGHVYLVPIDAQTTFSLLEHGSKPDCPRKPCEGCPENTPAKRQTARGLADFFGALAIVVLAGAAIIGLGYLIAQVFKALTE